jgi:hypothetical protein
LFPASESCACLLDLENLENATATGKSELIPYRDSGEILWDPGLKKKSVLFADKEHLLLSHAEGVYDHPGEAV